MSEIAVLAGKVALVTGSSSGAGVAIALELARHGAKIAIHCRSAIDEAVAVACRIRKSGGEAAAFKADLADADACPTLVDEVEQALGPISVLVNNA
ncbi:MAG TPA: SDR family NAD(P)-dependent oxidoreductase, partial [Reyranella sp.]|nr:SDR family NAD(P)-dependent oxidoreductase [Reyranella sp.]